MKQMTMQQRDEERAAEQKQHRDEIAAEQKQHRDEIAALTAQLATTLSPRPVVQDAELAQVGK